jgi:predicted Fe-Mo cluster-binding NifX family protein
MYIAVAADGQTLDSKVSGKFISCSYLLVINMDSLELQDVANPGDPLGEKLARIVAERDCEAVLTGELTPEAFEILADECVTRYNGYGYTVREAVDLMDQYELKLIRNPEETDICESENHEGTCDGTHHDHDHDSE